MALSEVAIVGIEPCVGKTMVVGERGRVEGVYLAGVECSGEGFDICRACATVGLVVDEGCAADEGGSVRASRSGFCRGTSSLLLANRLVGC